MFRFYFNCHRWRPKEDQFISAIRCLTENECRRFDQYQFQHDVKFSVIGQLLIRYLLSRAFQKKSSSFEIDRTQSNRPWVDCKPAFDFNVSHHSHLVAIAGTFHGQVGCDTMTYSSDIHRHNYQRLARKILSHDELNYFEQRTVDEFDLSRCFYRFWCLKESYVKWLGQGLTYPLSKLNFEIQTHSFDCCRFISDTKLRIDSRLLAPLEIRFDEELIDLNNKDQQLITVCCSNRSVTSKFVELTFEQILEYCSPIDENRTDFSIWWKSFIEKKDFGA